MAVSVIIVVTPVVVTTAEPLMILSWNQENAELQLGEIAAATLTLSTSWDMDDVDAFNFNLMIEDSA